MNKLGVFLILILSFNARALEAEFSEREIIYRIGEKFIIFKMHKEKKYLLSNQCVKSNDCLASKALNKKYDVKIFPGDLKGGKNPGSVLCRKIPDGKVVIGLDVKRNQQSFCLFTDKSLLSTGILNQLY